jgi:hypothetical protein
MPEGTKLGKQLQTLLETAQTLNTKSDEINGIITALDEQLARANLGCEVWLDQYADHELSRRFAGRLDDPEGITRYEVRQLGYARCGDGWHLSVREVTVTEQTNAGGEPTELRADALLLHPIRGSTRQERIAALRLLPVLLERLNQEAAAAIQTIEDAKRLVVC